MLTRADVFQALFAVRPEWAEQMAITSVTVDSRQVTPGSLFVALQGETQDGHEYIEDALARGASAVMAEPRGAARMQDRRGAAHGNDVRRDKSSEPGPSVHIVQTTEDVAGLQPGSGPLVPIMLIVPSSLKGLQDLAAFWRRRFKDCRVIGVTGSIGKTSTKELIASVLKRRHLTLKSVGNLNNEIGLPLSLLQVEAKHQRIVLEMGMYGLGEIKELSRIAQPQIGVITNVGPSHLERLGTIERIAEAKGELAEALPADGVCILNRDDLRVRAMKDRTRARVLFYGLDPESEIWADEIESFGLEGIAFQVHHADTHFHVRVPLLGRHSVHTALAASCVGLVEGLSWDEILRGLKDVAAQLRLIAVPGEQGTTILDDTYNASPESSLAALNLLGDLNGRTIAVLGDMLELGDLEEQGHRVVGGRAAQVVDVLVAVGNKGRWIGEAAREAGLGDTFFAKDNREAIEVVRQVAQTGDMILIKGSRGAKMEEVVAALAGLEHGPEEKV